jgi:hypothetical protein
MQEKTAYRIGRILFAFPGNGECIEVYCAESVRSDGVSYAAFNSKDLAQVLGVPGRQIQPGREYSLHSQTSANDPLNDPRIRDDVQRLVQADKKIEPYIQIALETITNKKERAKLLAAIVNNL